MRERVVTLTQKNLKETWYQITFLALFCVWVPKRLFSRIEFRRSGREADEKGEVE